MALVESYGQPPVYTACAPATRARTIRRCILGAPDDLRRDIVCGARAGERTLSSAGTRGARRGGAAVAHARASAAPRCGLCPRHANF